MKRRVASHWRLTDDGMALMLAQVDLRAQLLSYADLAAKTGMTPKSVRVTMWNLLHEKSRGEKRIHRGVSRVTNNHQSAESNQT